MYYYGISIGFNDKVEIDSIDDDWYDADVFDDHADAMAALEKQHGGVAWTQLDGYDLPDWLYDEVGIHGLYSLEGYVQQKQVAAIDALSIWMENQRYSNPEPWQEFEEHYIGEFNSAEDFGYHVVHERMEAEGIEIPHWLDNLICYHRVFECREYWQENGYYFYR